MFSLYFICKLCIFCFFYYKWYLDTKHYFLFHDFIKSNSTRNKKIGISQNSKTCLGIRLRSKTESKLLLNQRLFVERRKSLTKNTHRNASKCFKTKMKKSGKPKRKLKKNCSQLSTHWNTLIAFFCLLPFEFGKTNFSFFFIWFKWMVFSSKALVKVDFVRVLIWWKLGVCCKSKLNFMLESNAKEEYLFFFCYFYSWVFPSSVCKK